ncbi:uncharacterized protein DSM5745_00164 [Aspergillus mulundensis]|uniref:DUF4048 domain-containing protein n=1 Tax=Aspergillus mulundensis TaxID=1810919 RepID=A0A3D8T2Q9_9EURO|nr:Uncharacterized protein DSM5745_00164 [Aspergillus mulundensis]RDW92842.1 Uncharacterized protein DSM5745_00164 [Aspergillus mulundensis]
MPSKRSSLPPRPHGAARHTKRLTLNFPINIDPAAFDPSASASPSGSMTPVTRSSAARHSPVHTITTPPFDGQDDGTSLLTAIASQERRVLELREELHRAEAELDSLKKQWTTSERTRKRTEVNHRAEAMLPLRSPDRVATSSAASTHSRETSFSGSVSSTVPPQVRLSRELERRQSLLAAASNGTSVSSNGRRVFQGSHTRTLSLLSPTTGSMSSKLSESGSSQVDSDRVGRPPRSATMPSVDRVPVRTPTAPTEDMVTQWRKTMPGSPASRDTLMRTGKQMASDLREGLWTFLEDIRQATVGDEGINATESRTMQPRNRDSSSTSRSRDRLSVQTGSGKASSRSSSGRSPGTSKATGKSSKSADIDASFWSEFGIDSSSGQQRPNARRTPSTPSGSHSRSHSLKPSAPTTLDADETWDDWDNTPQPTQKPKSHTPSSSRSTIESRQDHSPVTQFSSPRTSTSFGDWRHDIPDPSVSDGIPWPALTQAAPSKLNRTASNLMAEWERSLQSSPNHSPLASPGLGKDSKND